MGAGASVTDRASITIRDPATGSTVAELACSSADELDALVGEAATAAKGWARTPAADRAAVLRRWARRLDQEHEALARCQTEEMGKPIGDSRGGVAAGIGTIEQYAELGPLHRGRSLLGAWEATDLMVPEPYGVAACILPWNDPVAIACGLVAACLAVGNTVVVKPSERAPLAVGRAIELLDAPPGIVGLAVGGAEVGQALVADRRVDVVCHVGSVGAGRSIAIECAAQLKPAVLELGGKDALVVDAGLDPVWAASQAAAGAFANAGQICTAVERIYVHRAVAEPFVDALVDRARSLVVGPGQDPATGLGPLVDDRLRQVVHRHVTEAVDVGAELRCGGEVPPGPGSFYPATVLTGCRNDMVVMREETFGPVAPVCVVSSFDAALELAADSELGLAASVLTPSAAHAQRAARELPVGTVKVNAVWGGAPGGAATPRRASGLRFGYGPELLDELTQTKVVHLRPAPEPPS